MILIVDDDAIYLNLVRRAAQMENLQAQVLTIDQAEKFRPTVLEYAQQLQAIVLDIVLRGEDAWRWLTELNVYTKRRRTKGRDLMGACGQLGAEEIRARKLVQVAIK